MSFRIERANKARDDLLNIWLSIAIEDQDAADRQLRRIEHAIAALADFPRSGPPRDDLRAGLRSILRAPHLVFYRIDDLRRVVQIVRIIDARRDLETILHP